MSNYTFTAPSNPKRSVVRWFSICFLCFSLVFLLALIPLISYCRNVFTELEIKKSTQQMNFGISQIENTVTGIVTTSQSLTDDTRFLPFLYREPDYSQITVRTRNQMKDYLKSLIFPLTLVSDCALQFTENFAITPNTTIFDEWPGYYPYHFSVDSLTYTEWKSVLSANKSGFLPVYHIRTPEQHYDALIYSTHWTKDSFFYACLNMTNVKQVLVGKENTDSYYLTIHSNDEVCLYSDLPDSSDSYYSVTQKATVGGLTLTIHIPKTVLTEQMTPLYYFLGFYLGLCLVILIITALIGSHLSSRPLVRIVDTLENHLNEYRDTIDTQTKVLQARFLEKALHGSLATDEDYESFYSYFVNFPDNYCLVLMGIVETPVEGENIYPEALTLVHCYLQNNLPKTYIQQLNNSELLLILDTVDLDEYTLVINHLIANINQEEPCYHAWGMTSKHFTHPKDVPVAYGQLRDLYSRLVPESLSQLCTVSDHLIPQKTSFQMADTQNIYSAIIYGNKEIALLKLEDYADSLKARSRSVFEMFRSILLCIKQEYANQLVDIPIPAYHSHLDMYTALKETVSVFCDELHQFMQQRELDPFIQEVKNYIDLHFTEDDLCHASLGEHFHCSPSKIQKAFPKEMGISLSAYIEKKRMELANELLLRGEDSVSEVARKCGFINDNTFYKAYRRTFGHAPTSLKQG